MRITRDLTAYLVFTGMVCLAACGGGGGKALPALSSAQGAVGKTAAVKLTVEVPRKTNPATLLRHGRSSPSYVSVNTLSLAFQLNTVNGATPSPAPTPVVLNVTSTSNGCAADGSNPGNYTCTIGAQLPIGSDNIGLTAYDTAGGTGNILSQGNTTVSVAAGVANSFSLTLTGNAVGMTVVPPTSAFVSGSLASGFTIVGSGAQTFTAGFTDPSGATIVSPGAPSDIIGITASSGDAAVLAEATASPGFSLSAIGFTNSPVQIAYSATPPPAESGFSSLSGSFNVTEMPLIAVGFATYGVRLYTPGSGTTLNAFGGTGITTGASNAYAVAFDQTGNLLVGNANGSVSNFSPTAQVSGAPAPQATAAPGGSIDSIATYSDGTVAALNTNATSQQLTLYPGGNLGTAHPLTMPSPSATPYKGVAVAFLPNGKSLVALNQGSLAGGVALVSAGATSCGCTLITSNMNVPQGFAVDPGNGDFYVVNNRGGTITRYNESGSYLATMVTGISSPSAVGLSPDGTYAAYSSSTSSYSIYVVNRSSWTTTLCTASVGHQVHSISWLPDDTFIVVANSSVQRYNTSCAYSSATIPYSFPGLATVSP